MAYVLKKRSGAPVVYDMHENYRAKGPVAGRGLRALEQWGFSWLDHVLLAEESYDPIVADAAVEATRIPNYFAPLDAVTEDRDRRRVPRMSERPRLLYTGTISDSRGLRTMVDLARQCREQDRPETIHLAGMCRYPRQRARVEQRIQQEQLAPVLERQGWDVYLQPIELWKQYPGADVGLALFEPHPNYRDSMPTKFYEYLYFGLPIICSDVPRWREFVERHDCGAVVPPGDSSAVLEVIDEWTAHPERYRQLAENARDAAEEYQWGPVGERLVRVYRDLIENRRPTTVDA